MAGGPFLKFAQSGIRRQGGLTMWNINGADTASPNPNAPQSSIKDLVIWNMYEFGVGEAIRPTMSHSTVWSSAATNPCLRNRLVFAITRTKRHHSEFDIQAC